MIGKVHPFVQFEYNKKKIKTPSFKNGGNDPVWNSDLELIVSNPKDSLQISCLDDDLLLNTLIGQGHFTLQSIINTKIPIML